MKLFSLILLVFSLNLRAEPSDNWIQWALRFNEVTSHRSALVGCYGTASYQYVLPTVQELQLHREELLKRIKGTKLDGFAWSSQDDATKAGNVLVVGLSDNKIYTVPKLGFPSQRGVAFCKCRASNLLNCTPSNLPPLAPVFFTGVEKAGTVGIPVWYDDTTKLTWHFRWSPVCWNRAKPGCESEGKRLPTLNELTHAQPRLKTTAVGAYVRAYGKPMWAKDEDLKDPNLAGHMEIDTGKTDYSPKASCFTAVCISDPK